MAVSFASELVAALAGPEILEPSPAQAGHYVPVFEGGQTAHAGSATGSGMIRAVPLRLAARRKAGGSGSFSER